MFKYMFSFFDSFVSRLAVLLTKAGTCLTWQGLLSKHNQVLAVLLRDSRDTDIHSVRSLGHFRLTCITLHLLVLPLVYPQITKLVLPLQMDEYGIRIIILI